MDEWKMENIPVYDKINFRSQFDPEESHLELFCEIMGHITKESVRFKSQAIRDALIGMGWTPPETGKIIKTALANIRRVVHPDDMQVRAILSNLQRDIDETDPAHE